jgi:Flp pilus assembly protein TadD
MRKFIPSTIMALVLTGTIVFLLSSCAAFMGRDFGTVKSRAFAKQVVYKKIETNPVDAESHYLTGCHFQKKKQHLWAIEEFQAAVQENPAYVEAYNRLGVSYDLIGDFDQALAAYKTALNIDPGLDYVHNNMGYSYLLQEQFDLAVASFQKAVALNSENSRYRNNLALAYTKTGQETAAVAAFTTDGDEAKAHARLGRLYYTDGEYEKAEAYYTKAARLKPKDDQTEKGLAAAVSLAAIYAHRDNEPQEQRGNLAGSPEIISNRYDKDGFYTIPAVPTRDLDNTGIVVVDIEESIFTDQSGAGAETPNGRVDIAAPEQAGEASRSEQAPLLLSRLQPLDETVIREMLKGELEKFDGGDRKRVMIEVSNGNGVRHMAKQVGHFLRGKSVVLMYLSNADHFNYDRTTIYYTDGHLDEAFQLSQKLPGQQFMQQVASIREGNADISVLIGKDLVPHREALKEIGNL